MFRDAAADLSGRHHATPLLPLPEYAFCHAAADARLTPRLFYV